MIAFRFITAVGIVVAAGVPAFAKVRTPSDQDKLQAACYGDVQRLCKDEIPDEGKITICMERQKASISAGCIEAYKATQVD